MTEHEHTGKGANGKQGAPANDSIAELLRLAGPRPEVPASVEKRVHDAVRAEWQSTLRQRRTLRWGLPVALAAAVLLAVALITREPEVHPVPIATVATVAALASDGGAPAGGLSPGDAVYAGDAIATDSFGIALSANNGLSLRLDAGTTATFESIDELVLQKGRVYADSGEATSGDSSITVRTSVGSATDIGTRFAVAFADGGMNVAVRHGKVDVIDDRGSYRAEAGDMLTVKANDDVVFDTLAPYDSAWQWAEALAPAFDIENRTLLDFLTWAARETGRELVFEDDGARLSAMGTRLHGSVSGFTPSEALESVLPTTRVAYRLSERQIVVSSASQ